MNSGKVLELPEWRIISSKENSRRIGYKSKTWWGRLDLNQRPIGYEPTALTTELRPRISVNTAEYSRFIKQVIQ